MFSTTAPWTAQRTGRRRSRSDTDFQMRHGRSRATQTRSPWSTRSWCHLFSRILVTSYFRPISKVELSMTYNCEDLLSRQTLLRYIHQNRNHNSMKINTVGKNELISFQLFHSKIFWVPVRTKFVNTLYHKPWFLSFALYFLFYLVGPLSALDRGYPKFMLKYKSQDFVHTQRGVSALDPLTFW